MAKEIVSSKDIAECYLGSESYNAAHARIFCNINGKFPCRLGITGYYDVEKLIPFYIQKVPKEMRKYIQYRKVRENTVYYSDAYVPIAKDIVLVFELNEIIDEENEVGLPDQIVKKGHYGTMFILYSPDKDKKALKIAEDIQKFRKEVKKSATCNIIACDSRGNFYLEKFPIREPKIDIEVNYGRDFIQKDQVMKERLSEDFGSGLVMLRGAPGTGKTNYIRHLINHLLNAGKKTIYVPPVLFNRLTDPDFIPFVLQNKNSVLVIEDAENLVIARDSFSHNQGISSLLNMGDGLLSDAMGVQILCTYNADVSKIDSALKRKGRIIVDHEFGKLKVDQAQKLSDSLGFKTRIISEMSLAEIYNQDEEDFSNKERERVGFNRN